MNNESGLKNRDPLSGCGMRDTAIGGEGGEIQQLSCAAGAESDKTLKCIEIADVGHLPYISFHIRLIITGKPVLGCQTLIMNPGIEPFVQHGFEIESRSFPSFREFVPCPGVSRRQSQQFVETEWQEMNDGGATRQGLADLCGQVELLRSGQDKSSTVAAGIDDSLQIRKQARSPLNFIENHTALVSPQKPPGIGKGEFPFVGFFQTDVFMIREHHPGEGGLAGLAGSRDCHHGKLPRKGR